MPGEHRQALGGALRTLPAAVAAVVAVAAPAPASAAPDIQTYPIPATTTPYWVTSGPDGKIWFVDSDNHAGSAYAGRMKTDGSMTASDLIPLSSTGLGLGIAAGPDGNLWATQGGKTRRVPPAATQTSDITDFPLEGVKIVAGPDGRMWTNDTHGLNAITTSGTITPHPALNVSDTQGLTAGPDGKLWFGAVNGGVADIIRMSTSGVVGIDDVFPLPPGVNTLEDLVSGPDGNVWATLGFPNGAIARITPSGQFRVIPTPSATTGPGASLPIGIAVGADNRIWYVDRNADKVGVLSTDATQTSDITEYTVPGGTNLGLISVTPGSDGRIWFSENNKNAIGALRPDTGPGGGGGSAGGGNGEPGSGGAGGGGATPIAGHVAPIAHMSSGSSGALTKGSWFSGAASLASGSGIADYSWDVDVGTKHNYRFDCGAVSAMSVAFTTSGTHTVGLQITDATGAVAHVTQQVTVAKASGPLPRISTFDCENPGANNQPDRADCVKTFGFGAIAVNSRGGPSDCFDVVGRLRKGITQKQPFASAAANPLYVYTASVKGPVALNGLYVPIPAGTVSDYDSGQQTIGLGHVDLEFGSFKTQRVNLNRSVAPDAHGVAHLIDVNLSGKVPLLGGLPIQGGVSIDLVGGTSRTRLHAGLPNIFTFGGGQPAQADVFLISDNQTGVHLDGAQLGPVAAFLGPVYLESLTFKYLQSQNLWQGGAKVTLPGSLIGINAAPPPPDLGFGIKDGRFDHGGLEVDFPPAAGPELFPGVFLKHVGGAFGVKPTRFTGTAGVSAGDVVDIDGDLFAAFASPGEPYDFPADAGDQLAPLANRHLDAFTLAIGGTASLRVPVLDEKLKLTNAYVLFELPDYLELGGGFKFDYSFLSVEGGVKGFVAASQKKFSLEGGVKGCLRNISIGPVDLDFICAQVGSVVSSRGIGFCGTVPIPFPLTGAIPVPVGVGYKWGDALPSLMIFSCDYGDYRETSPRAAQAGGGARSFTLPDGLPSAMVRLTGRDGAPDATLTGPKGERIATANAPSGKTVVVVHMKNAKQTLVALKGPAAGTWTVTPDGGSTPVVSVASADGQSAPKVTATVDGSGASRTLRYRVEHGAGHTVTFLEQGAHAGRILGVARGSAGKLSFTPSPGRAERRRIAAEIDQHGRPLRVSTVATFRSSATTAPPKPGRLRARRRGSAVQVTWARVPGAARYAVTVLSPGGGRRLIVSRRPSVRLGLATRPRTTVIVNAISATGLRGGSTRVNVI